MIEKRCAIYTRKSHEEGLEQEYNSLHAQRDSCEAYIKSQAHEGWKLVRKHYDDGGFSGGNLERPALKELFDDVRDGKVDVIVVYKIDRLTRSLMDFSKIMEVLDAAEASFAAVTQQFNTTTSMGRLTLNVLLSFAQFEREVTGERIRDKIAASKKKGMWMGGRPPLGYDIVDKKLIVNEAEAGQVRNIFEGYLQFRTVTNLVADLKKRGMRNKRWTSEKGIEHGGTPFQGGALYHMLQNKLYLGEIDYKGNIYEGEHKAIIPKDLWDKVQSQLEEHRRHRSESGSKRAPYLLKGIIFDSKGYPMSPTYSVKKGNVKYPYYLSSPLNKTQKIEVGELPRVPASTIDILIRSRVSILLNMDCLERIEDETVRAIVKNVTVYKDNVELEIDHQYPNADCNRLKKIGDTVTQNRNYTHVRIAAILRRHSRKLALVTPDDTSLIQTNDPDPVLVKNLTMAYKWREQLESGKAKTIQTIADTEGCTEGFIRKLLPLAYLDPDIIEAILEGRQPASLDLKKIQTKPIPLSWLKQRKLLGFSV